MKRIAIQYGDRDYSVADRDLDELKSEIGRAVTSSGYLWLRVNHGEGTYREADILIMAGTTICLLPADPDVVGTPNATMAHRGEYEE